MPSSKSFAKFALGLCCVSFLFQLLGYTCPAWFNAEIDLSIISVASGYTVLGYGQVVTEAAVWFTHVCVYESMDNNAGQCATSGGHNNWEMGLMLNSALSGLREINWIQLQITLTLAILLCIAAIAAIVLSLCDVTEVGDRVFYIIAAGCMLVSGLLVSPAVISVGLAIDKTTRATTSLGVTAGQHLVTIGTPWALALSVVGLFFAIVACIMLAIAAFKIKKEPFISKLLTKSYLSPAILKIGNFPATISFADRSGHIPPTTFNNGGNHPPRIGSRDDEPLAFQNFNLQREPTFEPYVLFPPNKKNSTGFMRALDATATQNSRPPPYHCINGTTIMSKIPGSVAFHRETTDIEDSGICRSPSITPRSKTIKMTSIHESDANHGGNSGPFLSVTDKTEQPKVNNAISYSNGTNSNTNSSPVGKVSKSKSPTMAKKTLKFSQVQHHDLKTGHTTAPNSSAKNLNVPTQNNNSVKRNTVGMKNNKSSTFGKSNKVGQSKGDKGKTAPSSPRKSVTIPTLVVDALPATDRKANKNKDSGKNDK